MSHGIGAPHASFTNNAISTPFMNIAASCTPRGENGSCNVISYVFSTGTTKIENGRTEAVFTFNESVNCTSGNSGARAVTMNASNSCFHSTFFSGNDIMYLNIETKL